MHIFLSFFLSLSSSLSLSLQCNSDGYAVYIGGIILLNKVHGQKIKGNANIMANNAGIFAKISHHNGCRFLNSAFIFSLSFFLFRFFFFFYQDHIIFSFMSGRLWHFFLDIYPTLHIHLHIFIDG